VKTEALAAKSYELENATPTPAPAPTTTPTLTPAPTTTLAPEPKRSKIQLPPPPTLKSKNLNKAGRGFVRIVDALGKSDWIEISAQSSDNSTLISSPCRPKDL
jgi:hypothetical protein